MQPTKHVYIAAPYRGSKDTRSARMDGIAALFRRARKLGRFAHSPLLQHWTFADADAEVNDGQYWLDLSASILELLSLDGGGVEIWLVKFPGWDSSSGVARELEVAQQLGIPVIDIDPTTLLPSTPRG